jgi:uncharacterized membrane protein
MRTEVATALFAREGLRPIHPLHAILLAFPLPLFLGGLLGDLAYSSTFHVQWSNFAAWLIAGGLFVGAFVVLWALVEVVRGRGIRPIAYLVVLLVMWGLSLVNALVHARDAWAVMPAGLWLSVVVTLLAVIASWIGYSGLRTGDAS